LMTVWLLICTGAYFSGRLLIHCVTRKHIGHQIELPRVSLHVQPWKFGAFTGFCSGMRQSMP